MGTASTLGRYVIERELGRGGMGAVYVAKDSQLGRRAALKVLLPDLSHKKELVERFFNEAKTASQIEHPSIVKIYDHGLAEDGAAFIVMELLEGESLSQRLKAAGALPIPTAVAFARQVANALTAAHRAGIIHRDLKPDNVYLVKDPEVVGGERVKLLDFGIAKLATDTAGPTRTVTGAILGTPHYMSPEQCEGSREVDPRTDLYSLGVMLFQMVSGVLPFEGGVGGVIGMHLHVPPPPLRSKAPAASVVLEGIVAQLLAKTPEERFQSAEAVAKALAAPEASAVGDVPAGAITAPGRARGKTELGVAPTMATPSSLMRAAVDARAPTVAASAVVEKGTQPAAVKAIGPGMPLEPPMPPTLSRKPRSLAMIVVPALVVCAAAAVVVALAMRGDDEKAPAVDPKVAAVAADAAPAVTPNPTTPPTPPVPPDPPPVAGTGADAAAGAPTGSGGASIDTLVKEMRDARTKRDYKTVQAKYEAILALSPDEEARGEADGVRTQSLGDLQLAVQSLMKKQKCDQALREARKGREAFGVDAGNLVDLARDCKPSGVPAPPGDGSGTGESNTGDPAANPPPSLPEPQTNTGNTGNAPPTGFAKQIDDLYKAGKHEQVVATCKANSKAIPRRGKIVVTCAISACKTGDEVFKKLFARLGRPAQLEVKAHCQGAADPDPPVQQQDSGGAKAE